ncbi:AFG1/ZapE family ATPase, partial [Salmonella enterica subsp. enterica serovar Montevideo]|nr:AFG1/ZapE family ATPase [Salmonella enterica subsp. enterica serovar Montevideo]
LMENEARRFIALVDEFYERHVKLVVSAAAPLYEIYQGERLKFANAARAENDDFLTRSNIRQHCRVHSNRSGFHQRTFHSVHIVR